MTHVRVSKGLTEACKVHDGADGRLSGAVRGQQGADTVPTWNSEPDVSLSEASRRLTVANQE